MASVGLANSATTASAMRVYRVRHPGARAARKAYKSAGIIWPSCGCGQPFVQFRPSPPPRDVAYSNRDRLLLANQHDQSLPSGHAGVEQVPLQHRVVLGQNRDYDGRVFGALQDPPAVQRPRSGDLRHAARPPAASRHLRAGA